MSGITLSASVRQNLLSLQSTSNLLAQTQERLSTGNKVNSALDNPTNYFTASALNNRAGDISDLLDSIGNGVQVLQAANTGITSLQSLIANAKSVANQALQASSGYSTKSNFSATVTGATAANLLGTTSTTAAAGGVITAGTFSTIDVSGTGSAATSGSLTAGAFSAPLDVSNAGSPATHAALTGTVNLNTTAPADAGVGNDITFTINSKTVTLVGGSGTGAGSTFSLADIKTAINGTALVGVTATDDGSGHLVLTSTGTAGAADGITTTGLATAGLGIADGTNVHTGAADAVAAASVSFGVKVDAGSVQTVTISAATLASYNSAPANSGTQITNTSSGLTAGDVAKIANFQLGTSTVSVVGGALKFSSASTGTSSNVVISALATTGTVTNTTGVANATGTAGAASTPAASLAFSVSVDGAAHNVSLSAAALTAYNAAPANSAALITNAASALNAADVAKIVNFQVGSSVASVVTGALTFTSAPGSTHSVATSAVTTAGAATGSTGITAQSAVSGTDPVTTGGLTGETLTIGSTAGGTATSITFGTGAGKIQTLDQLNTALQSNNLLASVDTSGKITIQTTNDVASSTIGTIGGTATTTSGSPFLAATASAPVQSAEAQSSRAGLVTQYNLIIQQIQTTAQDSSFNGVNLLNGDQLKLVFNETGSSTLNIQGVQDDPAGLNLSKLTSGTDFIDNASTNKVLSTLTNASNQLRAQASSLGSNLSIVQIRQDFSKNLINVLQTGASNLTLADTNQEAANSQALSTRQSIAVSALALANQSQQGVLQLLR
jgi:flagellin